MSWARKRPAEICRGEAEAGPLCAQFVVAARCAGMRRRCDHYLGPGLDESHGVRVVRWRRSPRICTRRRRTMCGAIAAYVATQMASPAPAQPLDSRCKAGRARQGRRPPPARQPGRYIAPRHDRGGDWRLIYAAACRAVTRAAGAAVWRHRSRAVERISGPSAKNLPMSCSMAYPAAGARSPIMPGFAADGRCATAALRPTCAGIFRQRPMGDVDESVRDRAVRNTAPAVNTRRRRGRPTRSNTADDPW